MTLLPTLIENGPEESLVANNDKKIQFPADDGAVKLIVHVVVNNPLPTFEFDLT